jgi:hypothetical protein
MVNLMIREWNRGSTVGNNIPPELKSKRKTEFERFLQEKKIFSQQNIIKSNMNQLSFTYEAAKK